MIAWAQGLQMATRTLSLGLSISLIVTLFLALSKRRRNATQYLKPKRSKAARHFYILFCRKHNQWLEPFKIYENSASA
jgi:hypothetical protein